MFTSAIKKQTSDCCSISLHPYGISNLESWKKESNSIISLYIADVSCLTNRSFYMRTLSFRRFYRSVLKWVSDRSLFPLEIP